MATHSSILPWRTPWTEEPGELHSMGLQRVGHDWATELNWTESDEPVGPPKRNSVENLNHRLRFQKQSVFWYGFPSGKEPACRYRRQKRCAFYAWIMTILRRRKWQITPVFLPGESHGQRSLVGYSPWGHKELDTTEWLTLSCIILKHTKYNNKTEILLW